MRAANSISVSVSGIRRPMNEPSGMTLVGSNDGTVRDSGGSAFGIAGFAAMNIMLLSVSVFVFFVVFGAITMKPGPVRSACSIVIPSTDAGALRTSATREAENGGEFLAAINRTTGIRPRIITATTIITTSTGCLNTYSARTTK